MLGTRDAIDYRVAATIGQPLAVVRELPNAELVEWGAYFQATDALEDMYARAAEQRAR